MFRCGPTSHEGRRSDVLLLLFAAADGRDAGHAEQPRCGARGGTGSSRDAVPARKVQKAAASVRHLPDAPVRGEPPEQAPLWGRAAVRRWQAQRDGHLR